MPLIARAEETPRDSFKPSPSLTAMPVEVDVAAHSTVWCSPLSCAADSGAPDPNPPPAQHALQSASPPADICRTLAHGAETSSQEFSRPLWQDAASTRAVARPEPRHRAVHSWTAAMLLINAFDRPALRESASYLRELPRLPRQPVLAAAYMPAPARSSMARRPQHPSARPSYAARHGP